MVLLLILICNDSASPKAGLYVDNTLVCGASPDQLSVGQLLLEWAIYNYIAVGYQELLELMPRITAWQREYFDAKTPEAISNEASLFEKSHPFTGEAIRL